MRAIDITVYYSTLRTEAMERILSEQGKTLDSAVAELLDGLYQKTVPLQERNEIEQRIRQEEAQTTADAEASRRFGVFHIREQGEDCCFTSELQKDLYQTACVCRSYLRAGSLCCVTASSTSRYCPIQPTQTALLVWAMIPGSLCWWSWMWARACAWCAAAEMTAGTSIS